MSEQKHLSYMQELDAWVDANVIDPLQFGDSPEDPNARSWDQIVGQVHQAIREKIRESYHNGQKAGPRKPTKRRAV